MQIPVHFNQCMAGQEVEWFGLDTPECFQKNLEEYRPQMEKFGWIEKKILYKFNKHGFRSAEFDTPGPRAVFLGCSHTFGVGLPNENTWPHLVSSALGYHNFNLGVGGSSNDTAFRLAQHWVPELKPNLVVFLSTELTRFELHTIDGGFRDLTAWSTFDDTEKFWRHWISNPTNAYMNYKKNQLAIKQLCADLGIKYIHQSYNEFTKFRVDQARDLQHFGIETNKKFAETILSAL